MVGEKPRAKAAVLQPSNCHGRAADILRVVAFSPTMANLFDTTRLYRSRRAYSGRQEHALPGDRRTLHAQRISELRTILPARLYQAKRVRHSSAVRVPDRRYEQLGGWR